jgi:hypothetical protein
MSRFVELIPNILFKSRSPRPFKILVIGNCQAPYQASLFEIALADCACDFIICYEIASDNQRAQVEAYLEASRETYNLILAIPLDSEWHSIGRTALIERFGANRLFFLLNLYFSGTHPDQTTLGELSTRILSPMGGLHSKIALAGWLAGLQLPDILTLFTASNMKKLGFFNMLEESARELRHRELGCDTQFADALVQAARTSFSFYTYNHPTPNLFALFISHVRNLLVARRQARSSEIPLNAMLASDSLAANGVWPVYSELLELLAPHFPVSTHFILPYGGGSPEVISRSVFVERSIAMYEGIGREKIAPLRQARAALEMIQGMAA